jgi:arylsulfatase
MIQTRQRTVAPPRAPISPTNGTTRTGFGVIGDDSSIQCENMSSSSSSNSTSNPMTISTKSTSVFKLCAGTILPLACAILCILHMQRSLTYVNNLTREQNHQQQQASLYTSIHALRKSAAGSSSGTNPPQLLEEHAFAQVRQEQEEEVSDVEQQQAHIQQEQVQKEEQKVQQKQSQERQEQPPQNDPQPLNIVLFYADDWTYTTLGAMGNEHVYTPHLDALAQNDGILFTHNCVVTSVCMQSRATLYTGQYSSVHQSYFSWRDVKMYEEGRWNQTLYPTMTRNNYYTGFFGKYHHLEQFKTLPPTFTKFRSTHMAHKVHCPTSRNRHDENKIQHVTQCNEDDGIEFLTSRPKDQPFFLTLSFFATHAQDGDEVHYQPQNSTAHLYTDDEQIPLRKTHTEQHWQALPPFFNNQNAGRSRYRGRYDTTELYQHNMKRMYRMANEVDTTCGKIIQLLKEQNVYNNTLIIFTTDNGNFHGEHGLSEKWYAYEESIRVPLIIKDPRMIHTLRGTNNSELTLNIDLAPTILSAANIPVPSIMQGRDISTMYSGGTESMAQEGRQNWRKEFLYEFYDDNPTIPNSVALVGHKFKYIYWYDYNYTQYFDLSSDPFEEFDLYHSSNMNNGTATMTIEDPTLLFIDARNKLNVLQQSVKNGLPQ